MRIDDAAINEALGVADFPSDITLSWPLTEDTRADWECAVWSEMPSGVVFVVTRMDGRWGFHIEQAEIANVR